MAASAAWKGGLDLAGWPINVALYPRKKAQRTESWRTIAPDGKPIRSISIDSAGNEVGRDECRKGVKVGRDPKTGEDEFAVLDAQQLKQVESITKTEVVAPRGFVPLDSIDLSLATQSYVVVPDKDVAGSHRPCEILWNGLLASRLAYVGEVNMRAGSNGAILAVYATQAGLRAITLPYPEEMTQVVAEPVYEPDSEAERTFVHFVTGEYVVQPFEHDDYESEWRRRREQAIEAAIGGMEPPKSPKPLAQGDLMEALKQSVVQKKRAKR